MDVWEYTFNTEYLYQEMMKQELCYTIPTDSYTKGERQNEIQPRFPIIHDGAS